MGSQEEVGSGGTAPRVETERQAVFTVPQEFYLIGGHSQLYIIIILSVSINHLRTANFSLTKKIGPI